MKLECHREPTENSRAPNSIAAQPRTGSLLFEVFLLSSFISNFFAVLQIEHEVERKNFFLLLFECN